MLIPTFSNAFYNIFYSISRKNGLLRDKAQYTNILSKADDNLLQFINRSFISLLRNLITNVFITTCS